MTTTRTSTVVRVVMRPRAPETMRRHVVESWLHRLLAACDPDQQRGRPQCLPSALARAMPALTRSRIIELELGEHAHHLKHSDGTDSRAT